METRNREITPELFQPLDEGTRDNERITGPSIGFWRDSWIRLRKNKAALVSLALIVILFAFAFVVGPMLSPFSPYRAGPGAAATRDCRESTGSARTSSGGICSPACGRG